MITTKAILGIIGTAFLGLLFFKGIKETNHKGSTGNSSTTTTTTNKDTTSE